MSSQGVVSATADGRGFDGRSSGRPSSSWLRAEGRDYTWFRRALERGDLDALQARDPGVQQPRKARVFRQIEALAVDTTQMGGDLRVGIEIERRLPHEATSVAKARTALQPLERRLDPDTFETVRLLVSELVTNSVRHGQGESSEEIELTVRASRETIRVEVADGGAGFEASPRAEGQDNGSGWGLHLLETLSDRWGTERNGRMRVWFELVDSGAFAVPRHLSGRAVGQRTGEPVEDAGTRG